ncbi:MAG: phosphoribosyltransferase [Sulfurimonas sp.]|jgi:putative phosphoribosyl transferase|nr:phosphoribosyltransferase [Sulfurimonas sp.]MBU1217185.1 phosphoribosyltransferase [bacterium]MBU1433971.1 phosphoribosyltransferase [bacterium]MBU1502953.1 phosphoribosyltransferase [bacterium]MBU3938267.1 phosphoribosyltransferase [bacterium]
MKEYKNILHDRQDAAKKLIDLIPMQKFKEEAWKIIAVSSGGLLLGSYLRGRYSNKLDFLFSEAIMAPNNHECEIARVSENEEIVINEELVASFDIKYDYIYGEARRKHEEEILSCVYQYRKGRHFSSIEGEVILLVDEGSETGSKLMSALKTILSQKPKAVHIAVPVIPSDVLESLEAFADNVYFLYDIDDYVETRLYYKEFEKVDEETIEKLLEEHK